MRKVLLRTWNCKSKSEEIQSRWAKSAIRHRTRGIGPYQRRVEKRGMAEETDWSRSGKSICIRGNLHCQSRPNIWLPISRRIEKISVCSGSILTITQSNIIVSQAHLELQAQGCIHVFSVPETFNIFSESVCNPELNLELFQCITNHSNSRPGEGDIRSWQHIPRRGRCSWWGWHEINAKWSQSCLSSRSGNTLK